MNGLHLKMNIHAYCERFGLVTVALSVQDIINYTTIDPMVQRKLSLVQRRKIARYLQERELEDIFFGPVTLSLRQIHHLAKEDDSLYLRHGSKLSIIDGQHRIEALAYVNEQLQKEVKKHEKQLAIFKLKAKKDREAIHYSHDIEQLTGLINQMEKRRLAIMNTQLAVQIYIGLSEEQEQQLFGDINSKIQLVSKELGHSFDSIDPLNLIIQQVIEHNLLLRQAGVEVRNNLTSFNKNFTCFSWLYSTAVMLFSGKLQISYDLQRKIRQDPHVYREILHQYFHTLLPLIPEEPGLAKYTTANRTMQEGLALYLHRFLVTENQFNEQWLDGFRGLEGFDWTHDNEDLAYVFGRLDNGKINLIHEKSLKKHVKLVEFFMEGIELFSLEKLKIEPPA